MRTVPSVVSKISSECFAYTVSYGKLEFFSMRCSRFLVETPILSVLVLAKGMLYITYLRLLLAFPEVVFAASFTWLMPI
jgi:hypothetical protein